MNDKRFIKGATLLIAFSLISKCLGAVYRIPLTKIIGGVGMGKYQLIFPIYTFILTLASSGITVAISKFVAEFNGTKQFDKAHGILKISVFLLAVISAFCVALVVFSAKIIAGLQQNADIFICYYAIAPAILFASVMSAFRGYFQGTLSMFPTAFSTFLEQILKMIFGLLFAASLFKFGVLYAVFGAVFGLTLSELCACIYIVIHYLASKNIVDKKSEDSMALAKSLINFSLPLTFGKIITPITSIVDSILIVNLLIFSGFESKIATSMLGLQAGVVEPLINIPAIIAISISTVLLPSISELVARKEMKQAKELVVKSFQITFSISVACGICFIIFGEQIIKLFYGETLSNFEFVTAIKLLYFGAVNVIFVSLVQISAVILQGIGRQKLVVKSLVLGSALKLVLDCLLIVIKPLNILGASIACAFGFALVASLNFRQIKLHMGVKFERVCFYVSIQACFVCLFAYFAKRLVGLYFGDMIAFFAGGTFAVIIFMVTYYVFFMGEYRNKIYTYDKIAWRF